MKRRDLIRLIRLEAARQAVSFEAVRNRGGHKIFQLDDVPIPVPNHREIAEGTARSILIRSESRLGKGWWR